MCLGEERQTLSTGQMVYIPPGVFHQLTNIGDTPLRMIYTYAPGGDVAHWRAGTRRDLTQGRGERHPAAARRRASAMHRETCRIAPDSPR